MAFFNWISAYFQYSYVPHTHSHILQDKFRRCDYSFYFLHKYRYTCIGISDHTDQMDTREICMIVQTFIKH